MLFVEQQSTPASFLSSEDSTASFCLLFPSSPIDMKGFRRAKFDVDHTYANEAGIFPRMPAKKKLLPDVCREEFISITDMLYHSDSFLLLQQPEAHNQTTGTLISRNPRILRSLEGFCILPLKYPCSLEF